MLKPLQSVGHRHWPELDLLRALAVCMMVFNHAGNAWLTTEQRDQWPACFLIFGGSLAPVVFFFVTGLGYGVQIDSAKQSHRHGLLFKVALLFVIEALPRMAAGSSPFGIDFLSFVGLSMLVLELLRKRKRPVAWAAGVFAALVLGRYAMGPACRNLGASEGVLAFFGVVGSSNSGYPVMPWLAYPLGGLLVGTWLARRPGNERAIAFWLLLGGGVMATASSVMAFQGMTFFRWGTVSLAFFIAGLAACSVLIGALLFVQISHGARWPRPLSLRGISSLAAVPVHYLFIALVLWIGGRDIGASVYPALATLVLVAVVVASKAVELSGDAMNRSLSPRVLRWSLSGVAATCVTIAMCCPVIGAAAGWALVRLGQVSLCLLLAVGGRGSVTPRLSDDPSPASTLRVA